MGRRRHSHRLPKIHRSYTVDEVARLHGVHRNTVRGWIREGLPTIDQRRPAIVRGQDLVSFHAKRRQKNKRPCAPGQIYCVKCKSPQAPAGSRAEYRPLTPGAGNLVGACPNCDTMIFRRVSLATLQTVRGGLMVKMLAPAGADAAERPRDARKAMPRAEVSPSDTEALRAALRHAPDPIAVLTKFGLLAGNLPSPTASSPVIVAADAGRRSGDEDSKPVSMHGPRKDYDD